MTRRWTGREDELLVMYASDGDLDLGYLLSRKPEDIAQRRRDLKLPPQSRRKAEAEDAAQSHQ